MANIIQIRRDLGANWTSADPTLADGELGIETDATPAAKMKIGNATDAWSALDYLAIDGSRIYNGAAAPSTLYNDHDYYIRTSNGYVYEQQSGVWVYLFTMSGGGGGGASWTDVTVTDANFTAADDTRYYLPASVLTANRSVNMGSITTRCMFVIEEDADLFYLNMTTVDVYRRGGSEKFTQINGLSVTTIEKVGSKLIQTG